jgi:ATP-binding cassette, subfamily C, type I secretion system permease/ATPase
MAARNDKKGRQQDEIRARFGSLRGIVPILALISGAINLLGLTGSFYMLQVYDRVLSSRSVPTLVSLSVIVVILFVFQAMLEMVRGQVFVRLGSRFDRRLTSVAHDAVMRLPLLGGASGGSLQPIRDVDTVRTFLASQGPVAILDLPWMPLFLAFAFLLHPVLGYVTVGGALVLFSLTMLAERLVKKPSAVVAAAARERMGIAEASERNAEAVRAMGFGSRLMQVFGVANSRHLAAQEGLSDITGTLSIISKNFRLLLQSALLGLGAFFAIRGETSSGAIIAISIASARALAPIEIAIAHWRGFVGARQAWSRLEELLGSLPKPVEPLALPPPVKSVTLEGVTVSIPGTERVILSGVTFKLAAGQALAVIGASATGKSTLARAITGVWRVTRGAVRLDGALLDSWSADAIGRNVGFMPQDVQLFDGTVTDNITRFEKDADSNRVIAAAKAADVHEMILKLPNGYETRLGDRASALSAGQRQRVALARALYGDPFLIVLDEPNSNLDAEGETALFNAIRGVRARGGIVIVIAHRPGVLECVDLVAVVGNGKILEFGPKDEVLRKVLRPNPGTPAPVVRIAKAETGG